MTDSQLTSMLSKMTPETMKMIINTQKGNNDRFVNEAKITAEGNKAALKQVMGNKEFFLKKKSAKPSSETEQSARARDAIRDLARSKEKAGHKVIDTDPHKKPKGGYFGHSMDDIIKMAEKTGGKVLKPEDYL